MPRNYKRKTPGPSYSLDDLNNAINDVKNGNMTYRQAAQHYGVPFTNIFNRIKGRKVSHDRLGGGRSPDLPPHVESDLANCLIARSQMGFPCDKRELKQLVQEYVTVNNLQTRFRDGQPGDDWYLGFMKRHPRLTLKKPEHLQKSRKNARDPFVVFDFFNKLKTVYEEFKVDETRANFVSNADESGFTSDPSRLRGIGEKGVALNRVSGGSGRDSTSVLACVSANGAFLPPLIVFKGAGVQARWISEEAYPGTVYSATSNGWMEEPCFYQWFTATYIPSVLALREKENLPEQTAVLIYDGHSSHISVRIIEAALANNIQLVKFPSHLTDKFQPLDKCVFGPIKTVWEQILVDYGKTQMGKSSGQLKKKSFLNF